MSPVLSALDVLHQQPGKQLSRPAQPLLQWLVRGKLLHRLSGHHQQAIRIRDHAFQKGLPGCGIVPVDARLPLQRRAEVAPQVVLLRPLLRAGGVGPGG